MFALRSPKRYHLEQAVREFLLAMIEAWFPFSHLCESFAKDSNSDAA